MARTRRQKVAEAAAADSASQETSPAPASQPAVQATFTVDIPEDLDFDFLSSLLPDTRLDSPTPESILYIYRLLVTQAAEVDATQREVEEARAEVSRKDVEIDQALQDRETATKELEVTLESVQKELDQVKQENEELVVAKTALQAELTAISSTQSTSSAEAEALKHRVEDTEREKRDLMTIVSRLKEDAAQREEEIKSLRSNLKQARHDHQSLETQVRELRSTETATKFKLESLSQQLKLAKDEAERSTADLAAKSEEFVKYRRAQHTELAKLQAEHDSLVQTHATTESQFKTLQSTHKAQSQQLAQALGRIQDLTGQLAEQEATFTSEAAGLRRLVEMMEEREAQAKQIVENIEKEWASVGDRAERREVVLREEIEAQKQRAEEAEKRVEDLQKVLDRMDRGEFPIPSTTPGSAPVTPARARASPGVNGTPDFLSQSMVGLSPTIAMASRVQRGGKTFTEVYTEYVKLQEDFARKSVECDQMEQTLTNVLKELEERAPVISQQREEYDRMQAEATLLASQLAQAIAERDANVSVATENGQKLTKSMRENDLLNKQLNDLGRQVRVLLKEVGRRQDPTIPSDEELEEDESTRPAENIDAVITNNLVLFRSIPALQEQNQKLLKVVRELGAKMEAEEKEYREQLEAEQAVALQEAYAAMKELQQQLEDNKKHSDTMIQAYMKERDALKSMLARERGGNAVNGRVEDAQSETEAAKELMEVTSQFEVYKTEMGTDSGKLREELNDIRHEAAQATAQLAKANARIEYLTDRYRMLQEENGMQNRDLDSLASRHQELIDKYSRIDIQCERLATELMSANAVIDQLRNETANLRAEKQIWESVQSRLIEENKALSVERSHLADLMANVQKMHNDLERSGENDRRRLESQIQMLENQTQDLRTQLSQERDTVRHLTLQKDLDLKELRTRIDKTSEEHAKTREALVSAQTSKAHLEEQVEQLTRRLQGNEEKLAVYERRAPGADGSVQPADQSLSQEQQLETEVAELRSRLKVAEVDLATARSHVQQFQEISQASEAALAALNATYDEYKASTEAQIAKHESEHRALEEKLQTVQQELQQLTSKNAELQRTFESERAAWAQDKKTLEDTIVDMTTSEQSSESERTAHANEIRRLEERAKVAEDRYGREVLSHADSIKAVENLRQQLSKAEVAARNNLTAAETAQAKLSASEASWKQQKDALEKEISDLQVRNKEVAEQNSILHQHLESVSSQAARIRQAAESSTTPSGDVESGEDVDTKLSELRSVVAYLRKEKEIVDLQLELSKQENTRLRTQIEHLSSSLEETRKTLSEERERAVQTAASEAQQTQLLERINQLNILRESNATLRADCEAHAKKARALETKLQQLTSELEPTKEQLRIAKAELEARDGQVKRLEDESRRWQERNAQLLTKYDRIDPAEMQALKDQISQLTAAKAELEESTTSRQTTDLQRLAELEARVNELKEVGKRNNEITRRRFEADRQEKERLSARISELEEELKAVTAERDELKERNAPSQVEESTQQIQALREEKAELERRLEEVQAAAPATELERETALAQITQERDALLAEKATWATSAGAPDGAQQQWEVEKAELTKAREAEKAELIKARDNAHVHAKRMLERMQTMTAELNQLRTSNAKLSAQLQEAEKERIAEKERLVAEQQAAVNQVRSELQSVAATPEDASRHAQELRTLEERLNKQHQEELRKAVESAKAAASTGSVVGGDMKAAIDAAVAAREQQLKAAHVQEITQAMEQGRMESAYRAKLKDSQLVRSQAKVKELEAQLEELKKQGIDIPPPSASVSGAKLAPSPSTSNVKAAPPLAPAATKPTPVQPAAQAALKAPHAPAAARLSAAQHKPPQAPARTGPATLPQKPGATHHVAPPGSARGRGVVRGRGVAAAAGLAIRGAGAGPAATHTNESSTGDSVSIIGAAGKRAREDGEMSGDDSLAKRLKPEGAGRPVPIQRNRVHTPSTGS